MTFSLCQTIVDTNIVVEVGQLCSNILDLYHDDGIIAEPAGALPLVALDHMPEITQEYGKNIVCIISGGNNDLTRYPEIVERSEIYHQLKHYYVVEFSQKPGELFRFITHVLGPTDDISRFEYMQKNNRETGAVLIGIRVLTPDDALHLEERMIEYDFIYKKINVNESNTREHYLLHSLLL